MLGATTAVDVTERANGDGAGEVGSGGPGVRMLALVTTEFMRDRTPASDASETESPSWNWYTCAASLSPPSSTSRAPSSDPAVVCERDTAGDGVAAVAVLDTLGLESSLSRERMLVLRCASPWPCATLNLVQDGIAMNTSAPRIHTYK